ncbi:BTB/POZ protein [Rhizophagus irregularis DAOM 181602=DAOM 197198]|nr:BTB/POZ protein [Rhizophagus irregularis DAOM 181602=DAOM 197198]
MMKSHLKKLLKKNDGKFILRIPNVPHRKLLIILRYKIFKIKSLTSCIREHLTKNQCEFLLQNEKLLKTGEGYDVIIYTVQNENVTDTTERAHSIIKNPEILFNSYKFVSLKSPIIELRLKRDGLLLDEIDIWNSTTFYISQDVTDRISKF